MVTSVPVRPDLELPPTAPSVEHRFVFAYALLAMIAWVLGSMTAWRRLTPFPPPGAYLFIGVGWGPVLAAGLLLNRVSRPGLRRAAALGLTIAAFVAPSIATAVVPGVRQPTEYPIPGRPWLAVSAAPDGSFDLYLVKGSAEHVVPLGETPWFEGATDLSPDLRHIVFASDRLGSLDLFVMDLDATGKPMGTRRLTDDLGAEDEPSWSPDGTRIVYTVRVGPRSTLAVVDADGGRSTPLTTGGAEASPDWSPDGRSIAYAAPSPDAPMNLDIWVMEADGSHPRHVVDATRLDAGPRWSPDGSEIAFTGAGDRSWDVYVVKTRGSDARSLTPSSAATDQAYGWTPDGAAVLFLSDRSSTGGSFLYAMGASDGSDVQLLLRL